MYSTNNILSCCVSPIKRTAIFEFLFHFLYTQKSDEYGQEQ
jgi:hypothetical protein